MKLSWSLVHPTVSRRRLATTANIQRRARIFHAFMLLTRLTLGGVLVYAGAAKATDTAAFADVIANFEILPPLGYQTLAVVLPWVEMGLGSFLICGLFLRASALLSMLLCLTFGAAVLSAIVRGLDIACGCFGTSEYAHVGLRTLAVDIVMVAASALVLIFPKLSLMRWFHEDADLADPTHRRTTRK